MRPWISPPLLLLLLLTQSGCVIVSDGTLVPERAWDESLDKNIKVTGFRVERRRLTGVSAASGTNWYAGSASFDYTVDNWSHLFRVTLEREQVSRGQFNSDLPTDYKVVGTLHTGYSRFGGNAGAVIYNLAATLTLTPVLGVPITHSGWATVQVVVYAPDGKRVGEAVSHGKARGWGYVFLEGQIQAEAQGSALRSAMRSVAIQVGDLIRNDRDQTARHDRRQEGSPRTAALIQ